MSHQEAASPLPPDPAGREDIMSDEPRGENGIRVERQGSPMPPETAGTEDALGEDLPDPTVTDG
jgi:hypothetical protein